MPGAEGAQAILTFETTGLPDENFHTRKSPATRRTWNPPAPLCEYDVITTYRLSKLQWSPTSLAELLNELHVAVDPKKNNTENYDRSHPHIPDRKSTKYAHIYSIDFTSPPTLLEFGAVLSLVSTYRKERGRSASLVNSCSFFVAAVFKVMQVCFDGSEPIFNEDVHSSASYSRELVLKNRTCSSNDVMSNWLSIAQSTSLWRRWSGNSGSDLFRMLDPRDAVFERAVDELVSQVPAALYTHPMRSAQRERAHWQERAREMVDQFVQLVAERKRRQEESKRSVEEEQLNAQENWRMVEPPERRALLQPLGTQENAQRIADFKERICTLEQRLQELQSRLL
ncbi:hypothetical protein AAF712_004446 [Marasmius tenuissimus]|uniref:Uncharacterized protein n=1 Tax=Marasmius tenuissimus TaxID=585030 RepID=A0ABR3A3Z5_9AGAR